MRSVFVWLISVALAAAATGAHAEILITVNKSAQRMTVVRDGRPLYYWPVSTGRSGYATPSGSYTAFRMEADHHSDEWDDAPMPHSIFFSKVGHAIHGTFDAKHLGKPASHGCVRLSTENAAILFELVELEGVTKTKVVLTGSEQIALGRRATGTAREAYETGTPTHLNSNAEYQRQDYGSPRDSDPQYGSVRSQYVQPYGQPQYGQPIYPPSYGQGWR